VGAGEGRPSYRPCRLSRSAWLVSPFLTNPTVGRSAGSAMDPDDPAHRMRTIFGFQFDPSRRTVARSIEVPIKWGFLGHFRYPSRKHTHKEDGRIKYALSRVCVVCGRSRPQLHRKPVFMGVLQFADCSHGRSAGSACAPQGGFALALGQALDQVVGFEFLQGAPRRFRWQPNRDGDVRC